MGRSSITQASRFRALSPASCSRRSLEFHSPVRWGGLHSCAICSSRFFFIGYPIPKIALFPVFTYIFGIGTPSKIAFTFLECLYPIVVTCYFGFRGVQTRLIWSAQNCGASRSTILRRVILPATMPSIFSGLRVALPVAIIVVVITEMIGDSIGLGYYITIWSTRFTFANVYAAIIVIGLCGLVLDQALLLLRHRAVYWQREEA